MSLPPETLILTDQDALFALKRTQLIALCKVHHIKANGKNVDLIAKLQAHGQALQRVDEGDVSTASSWAVVSEPDEEAQAEAEQMQIEFGVQGGSRSTNGTGVSTSSSSSSLASTIRSVSGSLFRRLQHSPAKSSTPLGSPAPPPPAPAPSSPALTIAEAPSNRPPTPKIYPSLSPTSIRSYSASGSSRPTLNSAFTADSPRSYISGGIRVVATQRDDTFDEDTSMDSIEPPTTTFELPQQAPKGTTRIGRLASGDTPPPAPSPVFIFGSPSTSVPAFAPTPFTFSAPSTSTSLAGPSAESAGKTAAELVMEEMNKRAMESRATGVVYGSSAFGSGGKGGDAPGTAEKRKFEGAHKRAFDKMDSITNHYAAKRSAMTPSTSSATLMRSSSSSRSLHQSTSTVTQPSAKRIKLPSSASSSLLKSTSSKSLSKVAASTSSDKKIVSNLLGEGWASAAPAQSVSLAASIRSHAGTSSRFGAPSTLGSSTLGNGKGKGKGKEMREGLFPNDGKDEERVKEAEERTKEREERKRKLELAKARRKSQVGTGAGAAGGSRRRSSMVGPKPREGNAASRFFKSTMKKFTTSVPVPTLPPASTSATRTLPKSTSSAAIPSLASSTSSRAPAFSPSTSRPAFSAGPSRAFAPSASMASISSVKAGSSPQVKKEPGWKRFNLQESLAKPLGYTPKLGPINRDNSASTSKARPVSSISSLASASTAFGTSAPAHKRTSSLSRPNGPGRGLSLSKRVANPAMLGAVKPGSSVGAEKIEEEAPVGELAQEQKPEQDVQMPGGFGFDFPSAPTHSIPSIFPSLPSNLTPFPLASPDASTSTPSALQPLTNTLFSPPSASTNAGARSSGTPIKKSGIPSSARKTRTAAGSKLGGRMKGGKLEKSELESKARKVVAKRAGGVGAVGKKRSG